MHPSTSDQPIDSSTAIVDAILGDFMEDGLESVEPGIRFTETSDDAQPVTETEEAAAHDAAIKKMRRDFRKRTTQLTNENTMLKRKLEQITQDNARIRKQLDVALARTDGDAEGSVDLLADVYHTQVFQTVGPAQFPHQLLKPRQGKKSKTITESSSSNSAQDTKIPGCNVSCPIVLSGEFKNSLGCAWTAKDITGKEENPFELKMVILDDRCNYYSPPDKCPRTASDNMLEQNMVEKPPCFVKWCHPGARQETSDSAEDSWIVPANSNTWSIKFYFPHLSRQHGNTLWRFLIRPRDEELYQKYPRLSFTTAAFQCTQRRQEKERLAEPDHTSG